MEIEIRTITPLWTGGVHGVVDRIHETGILGSLRWWYEAFVRGLGGQACDPSQGKCSFDAEKYKKSKATDERQRLRDAGLCDVCQVFGATGWRRRFQLVVEEDRTVPLWEPGDEMLNIRPPDRNRGWFLPPGRMGKLRLRLTGNDEVLSLLSTLFLFLEKWGNIGAKPQLGYGIFEIINRQEIRERVLETKNGKSIWKWETLSNQSPESGLPDLRQFGFFRYRFKPDHVGWWTRVPGFERVASRVQPLVRDFKTVPVTPAIKNEWRFHRWQRRWGDGREIFGALHPSRRKSKVAVSWAYPIEDGWEIRGWIWLSRNRWADRAWELVSGVESWQASLKVNGKFVEIFRVNSQKEVLKQLEATKND